MSLSCISCEYGDFAPSCRQFGCGESICLNEDSEMFGEIITAVDEYKCHSALIARGESWKSAEEY